MKAAATVALFLSLIVAAATAPCALAAPGARPARNAAPAVPDVVLARDIQSAFASDGWLEDHRLGVRVRDGVAELTGFVDSAHERARAARRAAAVPGVVSVRNLIRVSTARTKILGFHSGPIARPQRVGI